MDKLVEDIKNALLIASTTYRDDQFNALKRAINNESNENAKEIFKLLLENAKIAEKEKRPLCDDTGIPHLLIEIGNEASLPKNFLSAIDLGIKKGLEELPARPMAVIGNDKERIAQSKGLYSNPSKIERTPILFNEIPGDEIKIHLLMNGGGSEIRANTYRVFHKRSYDNIIAKIIKCLSKSLVELGCTPAIPAIGIGRSHFEANSLMIQAMAYGNLNKQSDSEEFITNSLNELNIGPLGLGGNITVFGTFLNIGPQRASGVRIVSIRPCCCVEPRRASVVYK